MPYPSPEVETNRDFLMLARKTVLILGAGASAGYGLPVGSELQEMIASITNWQVQRRGDSLPLNVQQFLDQVTAQGWLSHLVSQAAATISRGVKYASSVDDFLYRFGGDSLVVQIGKAAIASCILERERLSTLVGLTDSKAVVQGTMLKQLDTWIFHLFRHLTTGRTQAEVSLLFRNLSVINFNYDRCFELYIQQAIIEGFSVTGTDAAEIVSLADISHPYGVVGELPWQSGGRLKVAFGGSTSERLFDIAQGIKTFTEQSHNESDREHWNKVMHDAERVLFLGFGFHSQNMDLIKTSMPSFAGKEIVITHPLAGFGDR